MYVPLGAPQDNCSAFSLILGLGLIVLLHMLLVESKRNVDLSVSVLGSQLLRTIHDLEFGIGIELSHSLKYCNYKIK